jgi:hypothetical protein
MAFGADIQIDQSLVANSFEIRIVTPSIRGEVPALNFSGQSGNMTITLPTRENSVRNLSLVPATIPVMSIVLDNLQKTADELKHLQESGRVSHKDLRRASVILSDLEEFIGELPRPRAPQDPVVAVLKARVEWVSESPPRKLRPLEDE